MIKDREGNVLTSEKNLEELMNEENEKERRDEEVETVEEEV